MRSKILLAPLLTALGILLSLADAGAAVDWKGWDEGLREARESNRLILVDVYTNWCGWCRRMDRDVYARSDVGDYLSRRYVTIKLNAESNTRGTFSGRSMTMRSIASQFGVRSYPTTVFLRPGSQHIVNVPGYITADRFLPLLRYIGDGHLDRGVPFEDFMSRQGASGR